MPPKKKRHMLPEDPTPTCQGGINNDAGKTMPPLGVFMIEDPEVNDLLNSMTDGERQRILGNPTLLPVLLRGAKRKEVVLNQFKDLSKKFFSKFSNEFF